MTSGSSDPWVRRCPTEATPPTGPLAGVVVGVKDLVAVAGLPIGAGTRTRAHAPPEPRDAAVVGALRAAGASIAGTLALHELAFGVTGINDQVGFPPNPRDRDRIPGGSSSGSAVAVADGSCDLAVGTDTGGSVRIPAALCGVVGFKPSRGRYPLDGVLPLAPSLDHVGLLARTLHPITVAHRALTGDAVQATRPRRLGVDRGALEAADGAVAVAVDRALAAIRSAGGGQVELVEVAWPSPTEVVEVSTAILFAEAAATHRALVNGPRAALVGADVAGRLAIGARVTDAELRQAWTAADAIERAARRILAEVDAVAGPATLTVAPTVADARDDESLPWRLIRTTRLANLTGLPAVTVPVGTDGLPVGLQLVAASDASALGLAAWLHPVVA